MEWFQRGILTEKDTGGLKLEWGSADAILGLIEMIHTEKESVPFFLRDWLEPQKKLEGVRKNMPYMLKAWL